MQQPSWRENKTGSVVGVGLCRRHGRSIKSFLSRCFRMLGAVMGCFRCSYHMTAVWGDTNHQFRHPTVQSVNGNEDVSPLPAIEKVPHLMGNIPPSAPEKNANFLKGRCLNYMSDSYKRDSLIHFFLYSRNPFYVYKPWLERRRVLGSGLLSSWRWMTN